MIVYDLEKVRIRSPNGGIETFSPYFDGNSVQLLVKEIPKPMRIPTLATADSIKYGHTLAVFNGASEITRIYLQDFSRPGTLNMVKCRPNRLVFYYGLPSESQERSRAIIIAMQNTLDYHSVLRTLSSVGVTYAPLKHNSFDGIRFSPSPILMSQNHRPQDTIVNPDHLSRRNLIPERPMSCITNRSYSSHNSYNSQYSQNHQVFSPPGGSQISQASDCSVYQSSPVFLPPRAASNVLPDRKRVANFDDIIDDYPEKARRVFRKTRFPGGSPIEKQEPQNIPKDAPQVEGVPYQSLSADFVMDSDSEEELPEPAPPVRKVAKQVAANSHTPSTAKSRTSRDSKQKAMTNVESRRREKPLSPDRSRYNLRSGSTRPFSPTPSTSSMTTHGRRKTPIIDPDLESSTAQDVGGSIVHIQDSLQDMDVPFLRPISTNFDLPFPPETQSQPLEYQAEPARPEATPVTHKPSLSYTSTMTVALKPTPEQPAVKCSVACQTESQPARQDPDIEDFTDLGNPSEVVSDVEVGDINILHSTETSRAVAVSNQSADAPDLTFLTSEKDKDVYFEAMFTLLANPTQTLEAIRLNAPWMLGS